MRSRLIATVSAVILMAGSALAQTTATTPSTGAAPSASPRSAAPAPGTSPSMLPPETRVPAPNPLQREDISGINGSAVYGTDNIYANDTWQMSIMSYMAQNNYGGDTYRFDMTPMMARPPEKVGSTSARRSAPATE